MFDIHRVEIDWGGRKLKLETGRMARQADAAVFAQYGETSVLATVVAARSVRARCRFLPADRQLPGKDVRCWQDPRRLLQARRASDRKGNAHQSSADRPPHPSTVSWMVSRTKHRSSSPFCRSTTRTIPTSWHGRSERRSDAVGPAVSRVRSAAARVGKIERRVGPQPAARRNGGPPILDLVVAGTQDAVMMVESEAKELSGRNHARKRSCSATSTSSRSSMPSSSLLKRPPRSRGTSVRRIKLALRGQVQGHCRSGPAQGFRNSRKAEAQRHGR